jgi:hypothetical protein
MKKVCKVIIDIVLAAIFVVLLIPHIVETSIHELLGIILIPVVVVHVLLNWKWVKTTVLNLHRGKASEKSWRMFRLIIGLLVSLTITIVSGLFLSKALNGETLSHQSGHSMQSGIMPAMVVHRVSSMACMVFIILHIRIHWNYLKLIFVKKGK